MTEEKIAEFVRDINKALLEVRYLDGEIQDRIPLSTMVLEDMLEYFKSITPAAGEEEPDVVSFAQEVAEGHARNLSDYIRKLSVWADKDPKTVARSHEYDSALYKKHLQRYPTLGALGQRTFGRNNLGVMYLNLSVSAAFMEYFRILNDYPLEERKEEHRKLDEEFRNSEAFKAIVEFERGAGGLWVKQEFSFEAAAEDPKGFSGLGRW